VAATLSLRRRQHPRRYLLGRALLYSTVILVLAAFMFPFAWMVSVGLKPANELYVFPPYLVPRAPTLDNFAAAINNPQFLRYALNSVVVASGTTVLTLGVAIFSAYAFSRLRFPGRRLLVTLIILTQLLPLAVLIIPIYRIVGGLGLIDTYWALIIAYLTFTVPVAVWLLRGFFAAIPAEFEEAATIDGCTKLGAFLRVVLPLSLPGVSATATYVFFMAWQELMFALAFTNSQSMRTLPLGILAYIGEHQTDWNVLMAASAFICGPVFLFFLLMQRQFVAGLVSGGLKG